VTAAGKAFEIVFVSSDKDQAQFDEYFGEHPWAALRYEDRDAKTALSKAFKVQGIPTFVVIGEDGKVISTDGRSAVGSDPEGADFPWRPTPLKELIGAVEAFERKDGSKVTQADLEGKVIGLYFSAHWCPPCRGFTPKLAEAYNALKDAGKPFELIFVSSDRDESSYKEYLGEMPWCSVPFSAPNFAKVKNSLSEYFGVSGIPSLAIVDADADRTVITKNGRGPFSAPPADVVASFPFRPKPFNDVNVEQDGLNEETCLVLLTDGMSEGDRAKAVEELAKVATKSLEAAKAAGEEEAPFRFFYASGGEGVAERIRELVEQEGSSPAVVMLDIPDNGGYYVAKSADMTEEALTAFCENYKQTGRKQMS